jgi:hypothetical protein
MIRRMTSKIVRRMEEKMRRRMRGGALWLQNSQDNALSGSRVYDNPGT